MFYPILFSCFIILTCTGFRFQHLEHVVVRTKYFTSNVPENPTDRPKRNLNFIISKIGKLGIGSFLFSSLNFKKSANAMEKYEVTTKPRVSPRPLAYSVEMNNPPCLVPRSTKGEDSLLNRLAKSDAVIMGSHMNQGTRSITDSILEVDLLNRMLKTTKGGLGIAAKVSGRELAVGLPLPAAPELISSLAEYITKKEQSLADADGEIESIISKYIKPSNDFKFEMFRPIFHLAREKNVALLPLDVSNTIVEAVQDDGLSGLPEDVRNQLVPDSGGFVKSVVGDGFKRYSDNVLLNGYAQSIINSANSSKPSNAVPFENYIASRILRDEIIASRAANWIHSKNNAVLVLLMSSDQTIFGYGVQERLQRNLDRLRNVTGSQTEADGKEKPLVKSDVRSVLLNPSAADSLSQTVQLRLALAYGVFLDDQRPLADFLWFSNYPQVKLLTRPKNPINAEGEKPPGESSILRAF